MLSLYSGGGLWAEDLEAGTHPPLNPSPAPSFVYPARLTARWRPAGCGAAWGERALGRGRTPGRLPSHTAGLEVCYLDETGLRGENKDVGVGLFTSCGKVASKVGRGLIGSGGPAVGPEISLSSSKQGSLLKQQS